MSDEQEVFDPLKGYSKDNPPSSAEEARNAYYQGFVTEYEYNLLRRGNAYIRDDGYLVFLILPRGHKVPHPATQLLTKQRMEDIRIDHMLGHGDGNTLAPEPPTEEE
jgi:hypothetical protein